jgi:hypothetical protein
MFGVPIVHPEIWIVLGGLIVVALAEIAVLALLIHWAQRETKTSLKEITAALREMHTLDEANDRVFIKAIAAAKRADDLVRDGVTGEDFEVEKTIALMEFREALGEKAKQRKIVEQHIARLSLLPLLTGTKSEKEIAVAVVQRFNQASANRTI